MNTSVTGKLGLQGKIEITCHRLTHYMMLSAPHYLQMKKIYCLHSNARYSISKLYKAFLLNFVSKFSLSTLNVYIYKRIKFC